MPIEARRIGVSEFTTWPWPFEHDVAEYARHGVGFIEITEAKLHATEYAEQLASIAAAGLTVSSVQATIHGLYPTKLQPEPSAPRDRLRHIRTSIERIAPHVPPQTPFVVISGAPPGGDIATVIETAAREFRELAQFAQAHGVRIAFEPLNPSLMNVDSAVCSLDVGLDLVERVDHEAFGVCLDTWNIWQSRDLEPTIARAGQRIFLVQISDWREPRDYYDRVVPGTGKIPLAAIVAAAEHGDYRGPYVIEIFSSESLPDSLWRADLNTVLDASIRGVARLGAHEPAAELSAAR
jgi:sugar phosphate isomerase/epimerase